MVKVVRVPETGEAYRIETRKGEVVIRRLVDGEWMVEATKASGNWEEAFREHLEGQG